MFLLLLQIKDVIDCVDNITFYLTADKFNILNTTLKITLYTVIGVKNRILLSEKPLNQELMYRNCVQNLTEHNTGVGARALGMP